MANILATAATTNAAEKVVLQLIWDHQFQFAGYYAAKWKGFYAAQGLDVEIRSGVRPNRSVVHGMDELKAGRADFAIAGANLLVERDRGAPLWVVATIFQHSPVAFYYRQEIGHIAPADLVNLRVARRIGGITDVEFQSMLRAEGIDAALVKPLRQIPGLAHLADGRVDVAPGYTLATPRIARKHGLRVKALRPRDYGVDFYGDTLATHQRTINRDPRLVQRFVEASLKGWVYALKHTDEIVGRIVEDLPRTIPVDNLTAFNHFQAEEVKKLMLYPAVRPGHTNEHRWRLMHDHLKQAGLVRGELNLRTFMFDPVRDAHETRSNWLKFLMGLSGISLLVLVGVVVWNKSLRGVVNARTKALRESKERFRDIAESSSDWIWEMDEELRFTYFSDRFQDITGVDPAGRYGTRREDFVPKFETDAHPGKWAAHKADQAARRPFQNFEYQSGTAEDSVRFNRISGTPIFGTDGTFLGYRGTGTDITREKIAETALRNSEERYRNLVERSNLGIQIGTPTLGRIFANHACAELFGYSSVDDLMKTPAETLVAKHDRRRVSKHSRNLNANNINSITYEFDGQKEDGSIIPIQAFAQRVSWGDEFAIQRTFFDLTDRKEAEKALRESEERFGAIVDNSLNGISIKDEKGNYIFANKTFAEWADIAVEDIIGKTVFDLFPKQQADNILDRDRQVNSGPEFNVDVEEVRRSFGDGVRRDLLNHKIPIKLGAGKISAVITIMTDLTNFRETENKLHQAQKMEAVGLLTGGVAHDFNNILSTIVGNLEMASDRVEADSGIGSMIDRALGAAWRGATLTQRLLAFSRKQALRPQAIDAHVLVEGMTDLLQRTLEESISIEFVGEDDNWLCEADPSQLENAVLNLAINARDAMPDGGKLLIESQNISLDDDYAAAQAEVMPGQYVMVAVADTGSGMPQEVIDQVFDPFFTTKEVGKGSGLGLSMVYGFAKQSRGHVTVYSEEGAGTTVKLYLPRSKGKVAAIPATEKLEVPHARGETILVVEDDPNVRTLSVALLSELGFDVLEAADGPGALSILETSSRINLLFTDVVLPGGMRGPELAAEVTRRRPGIGVLYTSGYTENAIAHQGQVDGGVDLLNKPFRREDLARKVRAAIDKSYA